MRWKFTAIRPPQPGHIKDEICAAGSDPRRKSGTSTAAARTRNDWGHQHRVVKHVRRGTEKRVTLHYPAASNNMDLSEELSCNCCRCGNNHQNRADGHPSSPDQPFLFNQCPGGDKFKWRQIDANERNFSFWFIYLFFKINCRGVRGLQWRADYKSRASLYVIMVLRRYYSYRGIWFSKFPGFFKKFLFRFICCYFLF